MSVRIRSMATATGTAVTASSTETVGASFEIGAGAFANGKQIRMQGAVLATATNSTDTLTVKAYHHTTAAIGSGTELATSGAVDAADNDVVNFDLVFSPRSVPGSTSGTVVVHGWMTVVAAEGTASARAVHQILTAVDFTATGFIGVTLKWSTTSASNSATVSAFDVLEIL